MCIRDSCKPHQTERAFITTLDEYKEKIERMLAPVSYTHLDVYKRQLQGVAGIFAAVSRGDDIVVTGPKDKKYILPMLRRCPLRPGG